jgi:murein DD-endopeptidase MepM/ murein hydrolase activator NlpD
MPLHDPSSRFMLSHRWPTTSALRAAIVALLACALIELWITDTPVASGASTGQLQPQISAGQSQVSGLAGAVSAASGHLAQLQAKIAPLQAQVARLQADLDAKRATLLRLRTELAAAKARLAQLIAFETRAEGVLSRQLVNTYESDRPDIVSVVLEAKGFSDLLERIAFAERIRKQDEQIIGAVRASRRAVAAQATRLGGLEVRQQALTNQVLRQRNALAQVKLVLVQQQLAVAQVRAVKAGQLASAKSQVATFQRQLARLQAAQASAASSGSTSGSAGSTSGSSGSTSGSSGASVGSSQVSSGGGFTFPMPKGTASPSGTWSLDQGVDISAPGGTPLLAVGSGTIVLHGIGGFGPSAPVLHLDSGDYVYYGHAGPGNMLAIGTHVSAGQVISEVGSGIVGISTGPHLEIGFCDSSGTPLGPQTAPRMMSLLQGSYTG